MTLIGLLVSMAVPLGVDLISQALAGDPTAVGRLIAGIGPVIRASVCNTLRGWHPGKRLGPYDGDDLAQEIWLLLLREDGKRLKAYDPGRGSLRTYVAMVARTEAGQLLRREQAVKRGRGEQHDDLTEARVFSDAVGPEAAVIGRDVAERMRRELFARLSVKGQLVYAHVYEDGRTPAEAARLMNVTVQVIYNWQHKIRGIVREWATI